MISFDKLTMKAQEAVENTVSRARSLQHQQIETEHLLFSLLERKDTIVVPLLLKLGVDVDALRTAGLDDGEILEVNQVTSYFAYANRTVLGLGVDTQGDVLGLSPGDSGDPNNWSHG